KKSFGIQSPSTKFRVFGLNIIQGLIGGIKNNARLVVETVKNVFNTANKQAKKESDNFNQIPINGIDNDLEKRIQELFEKISNGLKDFDNKYEIFSNSLDARFTSASQKINDYF
ncbi:MAG: hypothetical protein ACKPCI_04955, partial [Dolichospermum sp.]